MEGSLTTRDASALSTGGIDTSTTTRPTNATPRLPIAAIDFRLFLPYAHTLGAIFEALTLDLSRSRPLDIYAETPDSARYVVTLWRGFKERLERECKCMAVVLASLLGYAMRMVGSPSP